MRSITNCPDHHPARSDSNILLYISIKNTKYALKIFKILLIYALAVWIVPLLTSVVLATTCYSGVNNKWNNDKQFHLSKGSISATDLTLYPVEIKRYGRYLFRRLYDA